MTQTVASPVEIVDLLAAIVRGDTTAADVLAGIDPGLFCEHARSHGVLPLVADRLCSRDDVAAELRIRLRAEADAGVVEDMLREVELKRFLAELETTGVGALVIKGSHLAYSHYPRPDLRPRLDTDILIPASARPTVDALLARLGYETSGKVTGDLVTGQSFHVKRREGVAVHSLDVHWKLASPLVFAGVLSFEELAARARSVRVLGPAARVPCDMHALLIACVHRVAHHLDSVRLIWLYDIDLIARRFGAADWGQFVELAAERKVAAVCLRSLERATNWFHTSVPDRVARELRRAETAAGEVTAAYLTSRSQAEALVDDLRTLGTWRDRWRLVREHVFPPPDYMRRVYAPSSTTPLPLLYAWRFLRGASKWLMR